LNYTASSGVFHASLLEPANDPLFNSLIYLSRATGLNPVFLDPDTTGSAGLTIDLIVNQNGNFAGPGAGVRLTGAIDFNGDGIDDVSSTAASPLLAGTITAFGTDPAGPPTRSFDGYFRVTGGLLTSPITIIGTGQIIPPEFGVGSQGGFFISAENVTNGILGNYTQNFSSDRTKPLIGAVPEPGGLVLALSGATTLCGFGWVRRRRRSSGAPRR
jgi:hypothetical protein